VKVITFCGLIERIQSRKPLRESRKFFTAVMPQNRKPPLTNSSRSDATLPPTSVPEFSIESTTMRLKSMRLRRAEREEREAQELARKTDDKLANQSKTRAEDTPPRSGPAGRVRHDERGMAVWDWAVATGEFSTLSTTRAMKKLEVSDLKIEDTIRPKELKLEVSGRDQGGGFDPYNQRGSGKREGEAAQRQGITGSPERDRTKVLDQLMGKKK
jgi:hypothetical protein